MRPIWVALYEVIQRRRHIEETIGFQSCEHRFIVLRTDKVVTQPVIGNSSDFYMT